MRAARPLCWLAVAVLLVIGCAPVLAPAGPEVAAPALDEARLVAADGAELPLRSWLPQAGPPDAVLIALHGFNDYSNFFDGTGRWLAARGIASYAYDQRGFGGARNRGLWPGSEALASDLRAAVGLVRARHPGTPLYLFGESMGGAVAMTTMARFDRPAVDGIILAAPAVWGRSSMPWYQTTALWLAVHTFPWSRLTGGNLGIVVSDNTEMLKALGRDPMVIKGTRIDAIHGLVNLMDEAMASAPRLDGRMLMLYGARDPLIPAGAMREMLERLPPETADQRRLALYPEGYHMLTRDLQRETVWRDIDAWLADPDAPLPSEPTTAARSRALAPVRRPAPSSPPRARSPAAGALRGDRTKTSRSSTNFRRPLASHLHSIRLLFSKWPRVSFESAGPIFLRVRSSRPFAIAKPTFNTCLAEMGRQPRKTPTWLVERG